MLKYILTLAFGFSLTIGSAQNTTDWVPYFTNNQLTISIKYQDYNYPEKGVNNRYLLIKLENKTNENLTVNYDLDRSYNGIKTKPDVNGFEFKIPANSSIEAQKDDLKAGLHLFAKMLNVEGKSTLSDFAFSDLAINGKNIEQ